LFAHPEPIETVALLPDHPPVTFTWRGVRRRVKRADGPERVFGEWWKRDPELIAVRDYFRIEDDAGERYWVFRAGDWRGPADRLAALVCAWNLRMTSPRYAELQVTSHFSFLRGASSCEELFATAATLGIEALAIVDRNSLAGIVRAYEAAKTTGARLVVGCRLDLIDSSSVLVYPTDRPAYSRLCRLLSLGKKRAGKAKCELAWSDLVAYGDGLIAILVPESADDDCALRLRRLREAFGDRAYMALSLCRRPNDQLRLHELSNLAARMRVATVVTNDVLFHEPGRRILQDVVTCIRHGVTIDELGERRERHADRYLKPPDEMQRLFGRYPKALTRTVEIVERCRFSREELAYQISRGATRR
jgi:error-prone DNA polymerase